MGRPSGGRARRSRCPSLSGDWHAWCLSRLGRLEQAECEFVECARLRPPWPAGLVGLAQIAWRRQNWDMASERFHLLFATFPTTARKRIWRGRLAECPTKLCWHEQAEAHLRALVSEKSGNRRGSDRICPGSQAVAAPTATHSKSLEFPADKLALSRERTPHCRPTSGTRSKPSASAIVIPFRSAWRKPTEGYAPRGVARGGRRSLG